MKLRGQKNKTKNALEKSQAKKRSRMSIKVAFLLSHPIQYFSPLFRKLARSAAIDLTVLYCSRHGLQARVDEKFGVAFAWDIALLEGYKYKFLQNFPKDTSPRGPLSLFNPGILRELLQERYDALIVHGYNYLTYWLAFLGAKAASTRLLLRGESHLLARRSFFRRSLKALPLKVLCRFSDGYLAIGSRSAQYAQHCGVPKNRIFITPYCVDNDFFARQDEEKERFKAQMLKALRLPSGITIFAFFGKLYPRKAPFDLLRAFEKLGSERAALLFVGDGISRKHLEDYEAKSNILNVRFTGFVNQSRLPMYYDLADVVVLPSREEPWGLVINEAMASGCAVVVSDVCGCACDLVREGENGYTFPAGDVEALSRALREFLNHPERIPEMKQASKEIISHWSPDICADEIVKALTEVVASKSHYPLRRLTKMSKAT
jgi:glycosyltransferase involved in cell wall biosynthesis